MDLLIIVALSFLGGLLFQRIKVPAGMLIGSMVVTALLVSGAGFTAVPSIAKYVAQAAAGMYIGCSSTKEELLQLRTFYKPAIWLTVSLLLINFGLGFLLWGIGYSDLLTCLMCAVPGGISDVTLIATDMGADTSRVLLIHLCRLICGIALFPVMVNLTTPPIDDSHDTGTAAAKQVRPTHNTIRFLGLCALCGAGAYLGTYLNLPAGCLLGAMIVAFGVRFAGYQVVYPRQVRIGAQLLSGLYIGCLMDTSLLQDWHITLGALLLSVVVLVANAYLFGHLMQRFINIPVREGMLMLTPAGVSDMALISADIGVHSPRLILMQLYRFIMASALFPQLCYGLVQWLGW